MNELEPHPERDGFYVSRKTIQKSATISKLYFDTLDKEVEEIRARVVYDQRSGTWGFEKPPSKALAAERLIAQQNDAIDRRLDGDRSRIIRLEE